VVVLGEHRTDGGFEAEALLEVSLSHSPLG
jgi:hypothetical protein